jgi:hypothetical protein
MLNKLVHGFEQTETASTLVKIGGMLKSARGLLEYPRERFPSSQCSADRHAGAAGWRGHIGAFACCLARLPLGWQWADTIVNSAGAFATQVHRCY